MVFGTLPESSICVRESWQLWLTARLLTEQGHITMPDDARLLIEGTFNESAQKEIPYNLKDQEGRAEGRKFADRAIAQLNILQLNKGYTSTVNQWQEDTRTPTRLGEAKVTVLLLRWDGSRLSFWSSEGDFAEEMSQITISERKISRSREYGGVLGIALNELKNNLKGRGKWRVLVPLREVDGIWQGEALDDKNGEVVLHYDERIGLVVKNRNRHILRLYFSVYE
jgi:CRISPR-associated endonuclease/helicase Cas3